MNPRELGMMALGSVGQVGEAEAATEPVIQGVPDSRDHLRSVLDRNYGTPQPETPKEDPYATQIKELKRDYDSRFERQEQEARYYRELSEKQFKMMEQLASRPQQPQYIPQQQQPEPLPQIDIEDEAMLRALNVLEQRIDRKNQAFYSQIAQRQDQRSSEQATRDFNASLKRMKTTHSDWDEYFNDKQVREDAAKILSNPSYASVDWDNELELAYQAKTGPSVRKELEELRKFKAEVEKRDKSSTQQQKANLSLVPSMGSRGASAQPTSKLLADSILADAKKAGKRTLMPKEFAREMVRRRQVG